MYIPLKLETVKHQALKERLLGNWPDCDEKTLRDTLEGITDLHEMIAAVIRSALVDEALQAGLRTRIEDMRQRLSRLAERGLKKRQLALEAMNEADLKKLEQPDFTASARTLIKIQSALETAGVEFLPGNDAQGPGVRLKLPKK